MGDNPVMNRQGGVFWLESLRYSVSPTRPAAILAAVGRDVDTPVVSFTVPTRRDRREARADAPLLTRQASIRFCRGDGVEHSPRWLSRFGAPNHGLRNQRGSNISKSLCGLGKIDCKGQIVSKTSRKENPLSIINTCTLHKHRCALWTMGRYG